jgi:regulator of sigma E protease
MVVALVLGFGFVIFFHELGHFLAAKWVGIKVEQFAVGFGQAVFAWRKGVGIRIGNTQKEYQQKIDAYVQSHYKDDPQVQEKSGVAYQDALIASEKALGLGETEYRLNWIPLGGYVKMLGQDDLHPNAEASDPRSYNRKSIRARMVVVSAGVLMNILLAGIGFMVLFMIGFNVAPAWVGAVISGSPAQMTTTIDGKLKPLAPGDKVLMLDGKPQEDFTKIALNVALSAENTPVPIEVQHADGKIETLRITPKVDPNTNFLSIGMAAPHFLEGLDPKGLDKEAAADTAELATPDMLAVKPGETITQIDGKPVKITDYVALAQALQNPNGDPVKLTVVDDATHQVYHREAIPHFAPLFGGVQVNIAGMVPRPTIPGLTPKSPARGKILPGDIVLAVARGNDTMLNPTTDQLRNRLKDAGANQQSVNLLVLRDGKEVSVPDLAVSAKIDNGKRGLGVLLGTDEMHPIVAGTMKDTPADAAGIPAGALITAIGDKKVSNWFQIQHELGEAKAGVPVAVHFTTSAGSDQRNLVLTQEQITAIADMQHDSNLMLREFIKPRLAKNLGQAALWGVTETRDFILQFYLTLRRMVSGSVSPDQLMGPIGIFTNGAKIAFKGWDWLLWFLAMISANLAVVNFLPIPIVDGGLFTFLILEKIQGKPLSPRAQTIAQYVGLAFLAGVFLFVTYHDILRMI